MTFSTLALVILVGLLGPLLAYRREWHIPTVIGQLLAGVAVGATGLRLIDASDPAFTFLANIGFGLVMFVAGTHVPLRDPTLRRSLGPGAIRAACVAGVAAGIGLGLAALVGTAHAPLYAVLMASSSAALILPIIDGQGLKGPNVVRLLPQVALADTLCIVLLPLVINPARVSDAIMGTLAVIGAAGVFGLIYYHAQLRGRARRFHQVSQDRGFALELRVQLLVLCALAALATTWHVSIMLAGFAFGIAVNAVGEPRRLARQLFGLTEGFLGPLFFVWLGATLNLREFAAHPDMIVLGVALGVGAAVAHLVGRLLGQPLSMGMLACAQLGVPVAAATAGTQAGVLAPGEAAAFMLGALVTIAVAVTGGAIAAARQLPKPV